MRNCFNTCVALGALSVALMSPAALAQSAETGQAGDLTGVNDIIVTAQKRAQNIQDVPVAVTALTEEAIETNRIRNINDISALAPNITVLKFGGNATPPVIIRGELSAANYPGRDLPIPYYLDGVWLGGIAGTAFEFPDLEQIEVLRGPQGTLFGRNSTAGAILITTKDPKGEFGVRSTATFGNFDQFRISTRIDTPSFGPFSASVSYTHDERRGDIRNLGAGTTWDRSQVPGSNQGIAVSPNYLGSKNQESVFVGVKFEPTDNFKTIYKFDWMKNRYTPDAWAPIDVNFYSLGQATGDLLTEIYNNNPFPITGFARPKAIAAGWTTPSLQKSHGHNLTSTLEVSDRLTLKNILAFRKSFIFSNFTYGMDGMFVTANYAAARGLDPSLVGAPFNIFNVSIQSSSKQWSDEFQLNYDSKLLTLTAGVYYLDTDGDFGGPPGFRPVTFFGVFPDHVVPPGNPATNAAKIKSLAGYAQAEVHVTPELTIVGGLRVTNDKKKINVALNDGNSELASYDKTRASYSAGINYKATPDILVYGKYANAYVAGGSVSGIAFAPEIVDSFEAGFKGEFFDRKLRVNIALFDAKYTDLQAGSSGFSIGKPNVSQAVVTFGDVHSQGFELEVALRPARGLTLSGSAGYTHSKLKSINEAIFGPLENNRLNYRPEWTGNLSAEYETMPLFKDTTALFSLNANYIDSYYPQAQNLPFPEQWQPFEQAPSHWILNGRASLRNIDLGGGSIDISAWAINLTNEHKLAYPPLISLVGGTNYTFGIGYYTPARTYGLDLTVNF